MHILIGLGNPGKEYEHTRHNAGRMTLQAFAKKMECGEWSMNKKYQSLKTEGSLKRDSFTLLLPETFMNKSGNALKELRVMSNKSWGEKLIILHDDIDLLLGRFKISFGKGSGGHKGLESVMRALKTKDFVRVRIGISPKKKPPHKEIPDFLLKKMNAKDTVELKKMFKKISEAIEVIIEEGYEKAMNVYN
ncbi:MAG: aminoacyl-tRNA hydrolase [Candidatus Niyogibacteria bacterium]|nr:aminoacyl-tRNA hydrolase [Candidatus Niyogibacteria bacterium]